MITRSGCVRLVDARIVCVSGCGEEIVLFDCWWSCVSSCRFGYGFGGCCSGLANLVMVVSERVKAKGESKPRESSLEGGLIRLREADGEKERGSRSIQLPHSVVAG